MAVAPEAVGSTVRRPPGRVSGSGANRGRLVWEVAAVTGLLLAASIGVAFVLVPGVAARPAVAPCDAVPESESFSYLSEVADATRAVEWSIPIGLDVGGLAYDGGPSGGVFVSAMDGSSLLEVSNQSGGVGRTSVSGCPPGPLAFDNRSGDLYAAVPYGYVTVYSIATGQVVASIPGLYPTAMVYDSGVNSVYVADGAANSVRDIDAATNRVTAIVPVGDHPDSLAYDSGMGEIFVANRGSASVTVLNDTSDSVVATIPVGPGPTGLAYDPRSGAIYVPDLGSDNVSVIDDRTNTVAATVWVGMYPSAAAYDPGTGTVVVSAGEFGNLSEISDVHNTVVGTIPIAVPPWAVSVVAIVYDVGDHALFIAWSD
jgi:YVTN family beta-propeller protein